MTKLLRVPAIAAALLGSTAMAAERPLPWMSPAIVARQTAARSDAAKLDVAATRARLLVAAMTLDQKLQQMTGSEPELLPELPQCYGARHVSAIAALAIPTFRITNGPVGLGQNDCVSPSVKAGLAADTLSRFAAYTHPSSARATALPSAMALAASFDTQTAAMFGDVIATEMRALGLHVFEAPGVNLARLPILGRNFEYFGEDPYLTGTMAVAELRAVQAHGLIAMVKHFIANEQETNRQTIQESIDQQTLHELYLLPFEMTVRDGGVAAVMCAYNYVNAVHSCENKALLTDVLRDQWGFRGYVQTDFFAMKSTAPTLKAGLDHEMPTPLWWTPDKLRQALAARDIAVSDIDTALERRFTAMFRAGIFDRRITHTPIDFAAGRRMARAIGGRAGVLLQNNGALPLAPDVRRVVLVGKASQPYAQQAIAGGAVVGKPMGAGGGSSDVVPAATVSPANGLRAAMMPNATLRTVLLDDANTSATVNGTRVTFDAALAEIAAADAVIVMAGTIAEEGADRATFTAADGRALAAPASAGNTLDWYAAKPNAIATVNGDPSTFDRAGNKAASSQTVAMLRAIMAARSTSGRPMAAKTVLVLKDNGGVALDASLLGTGGPAILEVWFPGQEDGDIVADLLFGRVNPAGRLPVTFPVTGRGFLDSLAARQFPGVPGADGQAQTVTYSERLNIGYRWYDADVSGGCAWTATGNPCVAFPFGHGLSYTSFRLGDPRLSADRAGSAYRVEVTVTNVGRRAGAEAVQVYAALPPNAATGAQPPKRLVGFARVALDPGRSRRVTLTILAGATHHPLQIWDAQAGGWIAPRGRFTFYVGSSSSPNDLTVAGTFER